MVSFRCFGVVLAIWALGACNNTAKDADTASVDADADTDTDSDTDADTDADSDTDADAEPPLIGKLVRVGTAVVNSAYAGEEDLQLIGDSGYGDTACRIHYNLVSVKVRDDCDLCVWAFDLEIQDATVEEDPTAVCKIALGYDASNVDDLNGTVTSRGFDPVYAGHASVILSELSPGSWESVTYATFDTETGDLSYDWDDGYVYY